MSIEYPSLNLRRVVKNLQKLWHTDMVKKDPLAPIPLDTAAIAAGYGSVNSAARSFFHSAKTYGIIEYDIKSSFSMKFLPLAANLLNNPPSQEAVFSAALNPSFFKELYEHFNQELLVFRPQILELLKKFELSQHSRQVAAISFCDTLHYIRENTGKHLEKKNVIYSEDSQIAIHFPFNHGIENLQAEVQKMVIKLKYSHHP